MNDEKRKQEIERPNLFTPERASRMLECVVSGRKDHASAMLKGWVDRNRGHANAVTLAEVDAMTARECAEEILVRFLLQNGAEVNHGSFAAHALLMAAENGQLDCVKALLEKSDPKSTVDKNGDTALMRATKWHLIALKTLNCLIPLSDAAARNKKGETAFIAAAKNGHQEYLAALLAVSDAKAQDAGGQSALMHAAQRRNWHCMLFLMPHSEVCAKDLKGRDAVSFCVENEDWDFVDAFADWISADRALEIISKAPVGKLPALCAAVARAEREDLAQVLALGLKPQRKEEKKEAGAQASSAMKKEPLHAESRNRRI